MKLDPSLQRPADEAERHEPTGRGSVFGFDDEMGEGTSDRIDDDTRQVTTDTIARGNLGADHEPHFPHHLGSFIGNP